jgi:hypothetical protein
MQDLTGQAFWTSNAENIAQVGNGIHFAGLVIGLSPASALITAKLNGITGSTMVIVTPATLVAIVLTPVKPTQPRRNQTAHCDRVLFGPHSPGHYGVCELDVFG